jgi:hypothetical protein
VIKTDSNAVSVVGFHAGVGITHADANDALLVNGLDGNDVIAANGLALGTLVLTEDGGNNNDVLVGSPGTDTLLGGAGDDALFGNGGSTLDGGAETTPSFRDSAGGAAPSGAAHRACPTAALIVVRPRRETATRISCWPGAPPGSRRGDAPQGVRRHRLAVARQPARAFGSIRRDRIARAGARGLPDGRL